MKADLSEGRRSPSPLGIIGGTGIALPCQESAAEINATMANLKVEHSKDDSSLEEQDAALNDLQSAGKSELFDAIDKLRGQNIDTDINVPQVVVCGDQSSGKSAVLEAIARLKFPSGSGTTTRFATELVLRCSSEPRQRASIEPCADRTQHEADHLRTFSSTVEGVEDFVSLHRAATEFLQKFEPDCEFWYDRFRFEVAAPDKPHLTLVDLPGLIHTPWGKQSTEDVQKIRDLVTSYVSSPRTVILAVVNAMSDLQLQEVVGIVRSSDNSKARTMGVITHPDRVESQDSIRSIVNLAQNKELQLGLGWHVVKNLSHENPDQSATNRDQAEKKFLEQGQWAKLRRGDCGISALRLKLSRNLLRAIQADLPELLNEMNDKLRNCKLILEQLGASRETSSDQRRYLTGIATRLGRLIKSALEGDYEDPEFADFFADRRLRLRDGINSLSDDFADIIRQAYLYCLYSEDPRSSRNEAAEGTEKEYSEYFDESEELSFLPPYTQVQTSARPRPLQVSAQLYVRQLSNFMQLTRGRDLKGLLSSNTIRAVFRQQSVYWHQISTSYVDDCHALVSFFLNAAIGHIAGKHTGQALWMRYGEATCDHKYRQLSEKLEELLWPFTKCHLMTYHGSFEARTQMVLPRTEESSSNQSATTSAWTGWAIQMGLPADQISAAKAIDHADAFYEIALSTFIENLAALGIERCLLDDLARLVTPETIAELGVEGLGELGGEPSEAREERVKAQSQVKALEDVIKVCRRHHSSASFGSGIRDRRAVS